MIPKAQPGHSRDFFRSVTTPESPCGWTKARFLERDALSRNDRGTSW